MTSHVFSRSVSGDLPRVSYGKGCELWDTDGKRYLDGSSGAVVVNVGHGLSDLAEAMAAQVKAVAYVHATMFTTDALEEYADALVEILPLDNPRVYPVSGGSEAVETALKLARAYHLARGEDRSVIIGRTGSYHGNSRGALDVSGRDTLRRPYAPWLGHAVHTSSPYEYRCEFDTHPVGCGQRHADLLDALIQSTGPERVAAFIAEPIAGAALGACVPPDDYWPAIAAVCRRYGVLVIADEVLTGFGRTGAWFASDHWGLRPDILTAGKGAGSGYWPLGLTVCTGEVHDTIVSGGFTHGFTYSHHPVGAAVGLAVLRQLHEQRLVEASARQGTRLAAGLRAALADHPHVGDVRGKGLLQAVELVRSRADKQPYPRSDKITEKVILTARKAGLLAYSSVGCATGVDGDLVILSPPLCVTNDQVDEMVDSLTHAIHTVTDH